MAESSITQSGVAEMRAALTLLPAAITAGLKATAIDIGTKVQASARTILLEKTRNDKTPETQATKTAAAIEIFVNEPGKVVEVVSRGVSEDPANNPIWLEHGTIHQTPKEYMAPARRLHEAAYVAACETATESIARGLLE